MLDFLLADERKPNAMDTSLRPLKVLFRLCVCMELVTVACKLALAAKRFTLPPSPSQGPFPCDVP